MHFLFIRTKKSVFDIPWALMELKHHVSILEEFEFDPLGDDNNPEAYESVTQQIKDHVFDFVISYLFIPKVSTICEKLSVNYISWTYDSPLVSLFHPSIYNLHNYTFVFDRTEYERLLKRNIPHLYHLPLGVNLSRTGALNITPEDEKKYACDISFIGNLYEENSYNTIIHLFSGTSGSRTKDISDEKFVLLAKRKIMAKRFPAVTDFITQTLYGGNWNRWDMDQSLYYGLLILTRKLAEMDRITVLNTLAEHYSVELYTTSDTRILNGIHVNKGVDYYTDMNKIFYLSKINLNITLPSIETGIPQRIFDIMGSGGFVLTNYQEEIDDLFTIGKDIEVFHDLQELLEKCAYYLTHEKERLTIAMNGYMKVRECHSYIHRINQILHTIEREKH